MTRPRKLTMSRRQEELTRDLDEHAIRELLLYIENTSELYPQIKSVYENLRKKIKRGKYDSALAPKLFLFVVERGVRMYGKEILAGGRPGGEKEALRLFPVRERVAAARQMARDFEADPNSA